MPSNQFSKQPQILSSVFGGFLNGGTGDTALGGAMTGVPSNLATAGYNQGNQDSPGDRVQLGFADALALSKTSVGTLYGGIYQYFQFLSTATAAAVLGKAVFINTASTQNNYIYTSDETAAQLGLCSGVFIKATAKGNFDYMQVAGLMSLLFTTPLTGVAAAGCGVFVAGDGAGRFDLFAGVGSNPTFAQVQQMFTRFMGVADGAPTANTVSVVNCPLGRMRW